MLVGSTGTTIIGVLALVIGVLLLSGASAGALVRRSGHAVKRAHTRATSCPADRGAGATRAGDPDPHDGRPRPSTPCTTIQT
jgi:hypothetical protein